MDEIVFNSIDFHRMVPHLFVGRSPTIDAIDRRYHQGFIQAFRQQGCRASNDAHFRATWHMHRHLACLSNDTGLFELSI